jgi:hypothetical protein
MSKNNWYKSVMSVVDSNQGVAHNKITRSLDSYYIRHPEELADFVIYADTKNTEYYTFYFPLSDSPIVRNLISELESKRCGKPDLTSLKIFWEHENENNINRALK